METKFDFAKSLIRTAGEFLKQHMNEPREITAKSNFNDLVTDLDQKVQDFLVAAISQAYPEDSFFAEEDDQRSPICEGKVWVIDPIDGTNNFIAQKTDFAIVLAYYENGSGQFGLIYDVMADRLFHGGGQFEVCCNERTLQSYQTKALSQSLIIVNPGMCMQNISGLAALSSNVLGLRTYGSAALSMARVLSGQAMGYFSHISPWDYAAGQIMGEKLGYVTLSMTKTSLNFRDRQYVMLVPEEKLVELDQFLELE